MNPENTPSDNDGINEILKSVSNSKTSLLNNFEKIFNVLSGTGFDNFSSNLKADVSNKFDQILKDLLNELTAFKTMSDSAEANLLKIDNISGKLIELRARFGKIYETYQNVLSKYILPKLHAFTIHQISANLIEITKEIDRINETIQIGIQGTKELFSQASEIHEKISEPLPENLDSEIDEMIGRPMNADSLLDAYNRGEMTSDQLKMRMKNFASSIASLSRKSGVIVPIQSFGNFKLK